MRHHRYNPDFKFVKEPEEFKTANTILHKKVKGNLAENWYTQLHEKDIIQNNKIYVDYEIVELKDENGKVVGKQLVLNNARLAAQTSKALCEK